MTRTSFKQHDVERLLRAAKAVGYEHPSVEKLPDGSLRLLTQPPLAKAPTALERWRAEHSAEHADERP